ncbi:MAG: hypothetical protein HOY76_52980 [Streptomyces sp.]|nr:hypothetical protein [Streptomyces sp.]NUS17708.1 hypothetical protein [Streptomyces sp.]
MSREVPVGRTALRAPRLLLALLLLALGAVMALGTARPAAASSAPDARTVVVLPNTAAVAPACTVTLTITASWPDGYQALVTVTANQPLTSWTVRVTGAHPTTFWNANAVITTSDGTFVVRSGPWNGTLPAGGSTSFGFTSTGSPVPPPVVTCTTP